MGLRHYLDRLVVGLERGYVRNAPIDRGRRWAYADGRRRATSLGRLKARTVYGGTLWCNSVDLLQRNVLFFGIWEPALTDFVARTLRPGDVFVDIGANIGYFTILAAGAVGPQGACVSIEALPPTVEQLEQNVRLNGCTNVRVIRKAVMKERGEVKIFAGRDANLGASTTLERRGYSTAYSVAAAPLHEILTEHERRRARLIKIDVEGAELQIIESVFAHMHAFSPEAVFCIEIAPGELRRHGTSLAEIVARFAGLDRHTSVLELDHPTYDYLRYERSGPAPIPYAALSPEQLAQLEARPHVDVIFSPEAPATR